MRKINGVSAPMLSASALSTVLSNGRGRDAHKARLELSRREQFKARRKVIFRPLDIECPHCGAKAGHDCVTASGNRAKSTHAARVLQAALL